MSRSIDRRITLLSHLFFVFALFSPLELVAEQPSTLLQVSAALARSKEVRGQGREVHALFKIQAPESQKKETVRIPVDVVVLLDLSGSMETPDKLPKAKSALQYLIRELGDDDRLALVSFSDIARIESQLKNLIDSERAQLSARVDYLRAQGGTNIGAALQLAASVLVSSPTERNRRVILLSDGQANVGLISIPQLGRLGADLANAQATVSCVGVGLEFSPETLDSVAHQGMGSYSYLTDLEKLPETFSKELHDTRAIYASQSELELQLADGVRIDSAGSYPFEFIDNNPSRVKVRTGNLRNETLKDFFVNFTVPENWNGGAVVTNASLKFGDQNRLENIQIPSSFFVFELVDPTKVDEAKGSINAAVWQQYWREYELGNLYHSVSMAVEKGKSFEATQALQSYKGKLKEKSSGSGISLEDSSLSFTLNGLEKQLQAAFEGSLDAQRSKQKSLFQETYFNDINVQQ